MANKKHCKICHGSYDEESDMIIDLWGQKSLTDEGYSKMLGWFCEDCLPPSAYIHPILKIYVVDRVKN